MVDNLKNANSSEAVKIKTHHARIVVDGTADKPYYSIEWFDPIKKEYYLGYSSYCIGTVFNWLSECFEIVEANTTNADRIRAMSDEELEQFINHFNICDIRTNEECKMSYCACCEVCVMDWLQQPAKEDLQ